MLFLSWLVQCLLILLSVAFFTLYERKVMGLFHLRVGPNKISFLGLLQPLLDAFKLLSKQSFSPLVSNKLVYHSAPSMALFLALFVWMVVPSSFNFMSFSFSILIFFSLSSVMVFCVLLGGWSSNSKYSLIGSLRSIAQSISYEAVFSTLLIILVFLCFSYSILSMNWSSSLLVMSIFPSWIVCTLAETHRAPFDFSESESELVSGFNTEYSGVNFALTFLSEYSILLFSCMLISLIFFYWLGLAVSVVVSMTLILSFFFIWVRVTFCRFRYDKLMFMSWKIFLPFSLLTGVICVYIVCF